MEKERDINFPTAQSRRRDFYKRSHYRLDQHAHRRRQLVYDPTIMKTASILTLLSLGGLTLSAALPQSLSERDASPSPLIPVDPTVPANPACWATLSCTFQQIESTTMTSRLDYVRYMQSEHFGPLKATNKFRAIEGVIEFFISKSIGTPGTWVSYVDAGIVEAIQRGGAIALGLSAETGGNQGTQLWADYLRRLKNGELSSRDVSGLFSFLFARLT